jgi:DNA-binding IclR family transcriptional regulator
MREAGYVDQNPNTGAYKLAIRFVEMAGVVLNSMEVRQHALPYLEGLVEQTGLTANLGVLDRGEVVYVIRIESPGAVRRYFQIGKRNPVHCTGLGKVLVSEKSERELAEIITQRGMARRTMNTIVDFNQFKACLHEVRLRGYATDCEELVNGVNCLAAPIRDISGEIVAAVSITGHTSNWPAESMKDWVPVILDVSLRISEALGFSSLG